MGLLLIGDGKMGAKQYSGASELKCPEQVRQAFRCGLCAARRLAGPPPSFERSRGRKTSRPSSVFQHSREAAAFCDHIELVASILAWIGGSSSILPQNRHDRNRSLLRVL